MVRRALTSMRHSTDSGRNTEFGILARMAVGRAAAAGIRSPVDVRPICGTLTTCRAYLFRVSIALRTWARRVGVSSTLRDELLRPCVLAATLNGATLRSALSGL